MERRNSSCEASFERRNPESGSDKGPAAIPECERLVARRSQIEPGFDVLDIARKSDADEGKRHDGDSRGAAIDDHLALQQQPHYIGAPMPASSIR